MRGIGGDQPPHALSAVRMRFGFGLLLTWAGFSAFPARQPAGSAVAYPSGCALTPQDCSRVVGSPLCVGAIGSWLAEARLCDPGLSLTAICSYTIPDGIE
jgi:hypothetical protein